MKSQICKKCLILKVLSEFPFEKYKNTRYPRKTCKKCRYTTQKLCETRHGIGLRKGMLRRLYGITIQQYEEMYDKQHGVCAICSRTCNRWGKKRLAVDHCHITKKVRGLLCDKCNKGLGQFDDSPYILIRAIEYLMGKKLYVQTEAEPIGRDTT